MVATQIDAAEVKLVGKATVFKPLSVARKTAKTPVAPQTLSSVASELQLDEATRRQLFGRQSDEQIKLVNFNTDQEYTANEELRASGDTVLHNPLRAIQPGKHSLRQLLDAATSQKDALEESWATGKRNKKEAGNKYGW
jgi:hypothetical protein